MRCHDETMTTVVRTLRNSIRTVGKLRDKTCPTYGYNPLVKRAFMRSLQHAPEALHAFVFTSPFTYSCAEWTTVWWSKSISS